MKENFTIFIVHDDLLALELIHRELELLLN